MNLLTLLPKFGISIRIKPHKKLQIPFGKWSIYKGDEVIVRDGKDKGKTGKVTLVYRKKNAVVVDGVNVRQSKKRSR